MRSEPKVLIAREVLRYFSLHFIREFPSRDFQQALGFPHRLSIVCLANGTEEAAYEIQEPGDAAGRQTRQSPASPSAHRPSSFKASEIFSDHVLILLR